MSTLKENFIDQLLHREIGRLHKSSIESILGKSCVKYIKKIAAEQFYNITNPSLQKLDANKHRTVNFAEIYVLTEFINKEIKEHLENAFNESYLDELKMKIHQAIETENFSNSEDKNLKDEKHFEKINLKSKNDDLDDDSLSVSSVHTSELSSFDDEITISSDEETGRKRKRMSLKEIKEQEDGEKRKFTSPENRSKSIKQEEIEKSEDSDSYVNVDETDDEDIVSILKKNKQKNVVIKKSKKIQNGSFIREQKRVRKPNLKYSSDEMINPFSSEVTDLENKINEGYDEKKTPRKRGRPRKSDNI